MKRIQDLLSQEFTVSVVMAALLGVIVALRSTDMPNMATIAMVVGLMVLYAVFAVYVWQENPRDEREEMLTLASSKAAYLVGAAALTVGTIVQVINHDLDVWLPGSLALMVLSKAATLYILRKREE